ncbi:MAG: tetratricopeptide repeat protein [Pseudomonadota bacterium]
MISKSSKLTITLLSVLLLAACGGGEGEETQDISTFIANADSFQAQGQYRSAIIEARNAMQAAPSDERGYVALAGIFTDIGQALEATKLLEEVDGTSPEYFLTLGRAYLNAGKVRSAGDLVTANMSALDAKPVERDLIVADLAAARGNLEEARSGYTALRESPVAVKAILGLARIEANQENLDGALTLADEALALAPDNLEALMLSSQIRTAQGDLDGAETLLMDAVASAPASDIMTPIRFTMLSALRDILTRQGKSSEAMIYSQLLAESMPETQQVNENLQAAIEAIAASNFEEARTLLEAVTAVAPNSQQAGTLLGVLEFLEGNSQAAAKKFEQYVDPEIATPTTLQMYALAELRLNQPQNVIDKLKKDIDSATDARVVALYGIAKVSAGELEEGELYLRRSVELNSEDVRLRLPLIRLYNMTNRPEKALEELEAGYDLVPQEVTLQFALLQQLVSMGRAQEAREFSNSLRVANPDSEETQVMVASYLVSLEELDEASKVLAAIKNENSYPKLSLQARIDLLKENWPAAANRFRAAIKADPANVNGYKGLVTALELQGKSTEAQSELQSLARQSSEQAPSLVLAEYYGRNQKFAEARAALEGISDKTTPQYIQIERALTLSEAQSFLQKRDFAASRNLLLGALGETPEEPGLLVLLIQTELAAEQLGEAEKVLASLKAVQPDAPVVDIFTGDIALAREQYGAAAAAYLEAWQAAPSDQLALKRYQVMRAQTAAPTTLESFFDEWQAAAPQSVLPGLTRSGHYLENGQMDKARAGYEALLAANANIAIAHNNLAWIYGEKELAKALAAGKKAHELAPNSGEIMDTYGWFLYLSGDKAKAREILAKAVELVPDNEEIQQHYKKAMED